MTGTLYLIPTPLLDPKSGSADEAALSASQPPDVRARIASLTCFAVENAKAARAFLKWATSPEGQGHVKDVGYFPA